MNNPFKVGDRVRRINDEHCGMRRGDEATVTGLSGIASVVLREFPGDMSTATHKVSNLELVKAAPVPMILPEDPAERKGMPITTGVLDYFPLALAEVAKCSKAGNDQHNPGKPLHWDKTKSLDHADCIPRHLIDRNSYDTDGIRHSAKLAWRALAFLQTQLEAERANKA